MTKKLTTAFSCLMCAIALIGCAASGKSNTYPTVKTSLAPQAGKGLVVIYDPPGYAGSLASFQLYANGQKIADKYVRGSFITYQADPGKCELGFKPNWLKAPVLLLEQAMSHYVHHSGTIQVEPNQTYYGCFKVQSTGKIVQVPKEKAEHDLEKCYWLNPPGTEAP